MEEGAQKPLLQNPELRSSEYMELRAILKGTQD
jgi:hypothetical protein